MATVELASVLDDGGITDHAHCRKVLLWCEEQPGSQSSPPLMLNMNPWAGPASARVADKWGAKFDADVAKIDKLADLLEQLLEHRGDARIGLHEVHVLWRAVVGAVVPAKFDERHACTSRLDADFPKGVKYPHACCCSRNTTARSDTGFSASTCLAEYLKRLSPTLNITCEAPRPTSNQTSSGRLRAPRRRFTTRRATCR